MKDRADEENKGKALKLQKALSVGPQDSQSFRKHKNMSATLQAAVPRAPVSIGGSGLNRQRQPVGKLWAQSFPSFLHLESGEQRVTVHGPVEKDSVVSASQPGELPGVLWRDTPAFPLVGCQGRGTSSTPSLNLSHFTSLPQTGY